MASVRAQWHDGTPVAHVAGEVDASNVGDVGVELRRLAGNEDFGLVVDLSETTYLDSAGINLLFAIGADLATRRQVLRVVLAEGSPVARMLAVTGFQRTHEVHGSIADALAAG